MTTEISIIGIFALLLIGCVLGLHCWLGDSQQGLGKNYFRYVISWLGEKIEGKIHGKGEENG